MEWGSKYETVAQRLQPLVSSGAPVDTTVNVQAVFERRVTCSSRRASIAGSGKKQLNGKQQWKLNLRPKFLRRLTEQLFMRWPTKFAEQSMPRSFAQRNE
jgi:hypothetical protein